MKVQGLILKTTFGSESYDLRGRAYLVRFYDSLYGMMANLDFLILKKQGKQDLMVLDLPKVFYKNKSGPVEAILPGDDNYEQVMEKENHNELN